METSAFAFVTDLADDGVDAVRDNLAERGGLGGITPAFLDHAARDVLPHNPRRKVQLLDRVAFCFQPDRHSTTGGLASRASTSTTTDSFVSRRWTGSAPHWRREERCGSTC